MICSFRFYGIFNLKELAPDCTYGKLCETMFFNEKIFLL